MKSIGLDADTSLNIASIAGKGLVCRVIPHSASSPIRIGRPSWRSLRPQNMNLCRGAPPHSKHFGPTVMTSASAALSGGVESGWDKVASRLDWASSQFSQGTRVERKLDPQSGPTSRTSSRSSTFDSVPGRTEESTLELRVTMVFRNEVLSRSKNPLKNATIALPPR